VNGLAVFDGILFALGSVVFLHFGFTELALWSGCLLLIYLTRQICLAIEKDRKGAQ
jgi:hypothetical protein